MRPSSARTFKSDRTCCRQPSRRPPAAPEADGSGNGAAATGEAEEAGEDAGSGAAGAALIDPFCALRAGVRALTSCKRDGPDSAEGAHWLDLARRFAAPRPARRPASAKRGAAPAAPFFCRLAAPVYDGVCYQD